MSEITYYQRNRDIILNRAKEYYKSNKELLRKRAKINIDQYQKMKRI